MSDRCKHCNVLFSHHDGVSVLCCEKQHIQSELLALRSRLENAEALLDSGLIYLSKCIHKQVDLRRAIQKAIDYEAQPYDSQPAPIRKEGEGKEV